MNVVAQFFDGNKADALLEKGVLILHLFKIYGEVSMFARTHGAQDITFLYALDEEAAKKMAERIALHEAKDLGYPIRYKKETVVIAPSNW